MNRYSILSCFSPNRDYVCVALIPSFNLWSTELMKGLFQKEKHPKYCYVKTVLATISNKVADDVDQTSDSTD